ncbi:RagB/SusD family nutrient uptake outer membrane protein [Pedobacter deserti]|uniref:RagB/SusD family nutrient uptake outer membrane protein n=1 Tax=Pedobacter deserti TaxID=2817382 RepID=UPI00210DF00D|nr:RagB/SusD family nutrient uptake outer membrane protein [Pedobacter sp. SYSU D00382]
MKRKLNQISHICFCMLLLTFTGCKKLIEIDLPIDKFTSEKVYSTTRSSVLVLNGIYTELSKSASFAGGNSLSHLGSGLADELELPDRSSIYTNSYNSLDLPGFDSTWDNYYRFIIYRVNSFIDGVSPSSGIPEEDKAILLGEAKFIRALCYFDLVNLWGDVPLITGTDFKMNSVAPRSPQAAVYDQIIQDLIGAQTGLKDNFLGVDLVTTTMERVRPNKAAATALLARVYLYNEEWAKAEAEATKVINQKAHYDIVPLLGVFLKNSKETIWALQPVSNSTGANTQLGRMYVNPYNNPPFDKASLSPFLLSEFETNDRRKVEWISSVTDFSGNIYAIPYKYKAGVDDPDLKEYTVVLRLSEQYLIRAEARAKLGNLDGAKSDINVVRTRAGLLSTTASSDEQVLSAIAHERYVELFTEFGHRWFDLKRTGKINERMEQVMSSKGGVWQSYKALLPIAFFEMQGNPSLKQTPGY